jgi:hypothetical protein
MLLLHLADSMFSLALPWRWRKENHGLEKERKLTWRKQRRKFLLKSQTEGSQVLGFDRKGDFLIWASKSNGSKPIALSPGPVGLI